MQTPGSLASFHALIESSLADTDLAIATIAGHEDEPAMIAYADYGVPWHWSACQDDHGLRDIRSYKQSVGNGNCAAWMDNTTLVTAATLMSDMGPDAMTPLTVWDLVTVTRAVVCFEHIYHHSHPKVDDAQINAILGENVLIPIPVPLRQVEPNQVLPDPWDGAHRWMCEVWSDAYQWMAGLNRAVGSTTLDGQQLAAVTESWQVALHRDDLTPDMLVNFKALNVRWTSPSNRLLAETANATDVEDTTVYIDPSDSLRRLFQSRRELGIHDQSCERLSDLLSDLNLRSYINQRIADFFQLPYVCSAARIPFRRYLYNRAVEVRATLTTVGVIENRYGELGDNVRLRLPVFLALALLGCSKPGHIWARLAELRRDANKFRSCRSVLDEALARQDLKEAARVSKALHLAVEDVLAVAGRATAAVGIAVVDHIAHGDLSTIKTGVAALAAAGGEVFRSSFKDRLVWRLRRPDLLWLNNVTDQANALTEALPDFSRIWQIPENRQSMFAERFAGMARLQG
jgi:hypothetical protein